MSHLRRDWIGAAATLLIAGTTVGVAHGATLYVGVGGNDGNPGTKEQPLATLEAARDALRKAATVPQRLVLLPGDYYRTRTFELDARDTGLVLETEGDGTATLHGGALVTGWRPDGDKLWCADVPGVKEGTWDFRALVVNDRLSERARLPASGTFLHTSSFDVRWLSTVGGGWERKPNPDELTTMSYDPKDIPATLDIRNAEVRVYHMWDESMVGVASHDRQHHTLIFSPPAQSPPGAFGVKKYVIFNTREGMTQPGQWYLDRTAGRVVYWPLPGEDMTRAKVVAPRLERIVSIMGNRQQPVENVTIQGLALRATTTPLKAGGFGAYAFDGALRMDQARQCTLARLDIGNVGGQGILAGQLTACRIVACHVHHAGACGMKIDGSDVLIERNHIHDVGVYYPSAIALSGSGRTEKGLHIYRNEIHDAPYSGIVASGENHRIEENLIYRIMRELQDGGAIYGGIRNSILRGNVVRDVVKMGEGYGVSAYYLDEGAQNCLVERNVSVGVERPTHNHIARNIVIRDNVFIAETNMTLSFQRSGGCTFEGNTLFVPGQITIQQPSAINVWKNNIIFRNGVGQGGAPQPFTIGDAMPPVPTPERRTGVAPVVRVTQPPTLDGEIGWDEWPGGLLNLDREPSRWNAGGAPVFAELSYDDRCLYVAVNVVMFAATKLSKGATWGQNDGAEVSVTGNTSAGMPTTFVIRGFADGHLHSATDAGAPAEAAELLGQSVRFVAKSYGDNRGGWRGEWAIPLEMMGLKPTPGGKTPFNLSVFRSEDEVWRCWEGTLAETWRVDQAGFLQFK